MSLLALFCDVYGFCLAYDQHMNQRGLGPTGVRRGPKPTLPSSDIITVIIHFHQSEYRHFKAYYSKHVIVHLQSDFLKLVSYNRFVELMPGAFLPLCFHLHSRLGQVTGISFVDSTPLAVCHNKHINRHRL
jgi:hypothetical protein